MTSTFVRHVLILQKHRTGTLDPIQRIELIENKMTEKMTEGPKIKKL